MSDTPADPDPAAARRLMRRQGRAVLGTSFEGGPYVSLVLCAFEADASPLLMISALAQHTKNIAADPRVSLLFEETQGLANPLTGARLTVLGRAEPCSDERALSRYVARQPSARLYAEFGDFQLYRVSVERGHLVAGFGRIAWVRGEALQVGGAEALAEAEPEIVEHMNADHAEAVRLYANRLLGRVGEGWVMSGIDPDGTDLRCGEETARLDFAAPVLDPAAARAELVRLAREARAG